ncbi:MAG: endopeptidase La [Eubacteriales bacterium]|jgi:ATP-dependent Lon protease
MTLNNKNESNNNTNIKMPMLALRGLTVFPDMVLHFDVGREKSVRALDQCMLEGQTIFLVTQKDIRIEDPDMDDLYHVGTVSKVRQIFRLPGDNIRLIVEGSYRARLVDIVQSEEFLIAEIERIFETESEQSPKRREALIREAQNAFDEYAQAAPRMTNEVLVRVLSTEETGYLADYITQNISIRQAEKQEILEITDKTKRLEKVCAILYREAELLELESEIHSRVREQVVRHQREYYLREQLRAIQSELGQAPDEEDDEGEYTARIRALKLEQEYEEKLLKEAARLDHMHPGSAEAAVVRTYLDTCLEVPWHTMTKEKLNISNVSKKLDADHYGLEKVKERILEYLSVRKLSPELKGQIICLVGPPGTGKTSIANSIAQAINRKFARMSLGGVRDEAEIRGHRKTYVGAMPGRIINAVIQAGSKNPLILMDEIDKLGNDFRGDPASALLEVLDSEQNSTFRDHYLEMPFDLSEVMFITTANTLDTIPRPLIDRMEVIEVTSYTDEEKVQIAKRHLMQKQLKNHGLSRSTLRINDDAIREIIVCYTRESGVRQLEREIAAICRKAAKRIALGEIKTATVSAGSVEKYLGVRKYKPESIKRTDEVGVVHGLAWTQSGGDILEVEASIVDGSGKLELTGNLGDVLKESGKAALTYIRSRTDALDIDPNFYKEKDIHLHFPEGAIPKDGPSAGIAITTAIVSALTNAPVRGDVAMTGEVTIRGRVLPIGGLKEKTMAAYRNGIKTVIIPAANEADIEEIDPTVKKALQFILVENADSVIKYAIDFSRRAKKVQKKEKANESIGSINDLSQVFSNESENALNNERQVLQ